MINPNPTANTLTKRVSTNREYISLASLIGMCNLYGVDFVLKIVNRDGRKQKVTVDHLMIDEMSLIVESEEEKAARKKRVGQMARNEMKSYEANIVNMMGEYLIGTYGLGFQLTKSRSTVKTVKMMKYRWIDPFNEEGYKVFGERVIEAVYRMPSEMISGKHSVVRIAKENVDIYQIYMDIVSDVKMLSPRGYQMLYGISSQEIGTCQFEQECQFEQQEEGNGQIEMYPQQEEPYNQQDMEGYQQEEVEMYPQTQQEVYFFQPSVMMTNEEENSLPPSTASVATLSLLSPPPMSTTTMMMEGNQTYQSQQLEQLEEQEEEMCIKEETPTGMYTAASGNKIESNENKMKEEEQENNENNENYRMIYEWMMTGMESGNGYAYPINYFFNNHNNNNTSY